MAYATGTYTDIDDALALFYAWALTNGWTQRYTGAITLGTRAHISKVIDGVPTFFNFRTGYSDAYTAPTLHRKGIHVTGSTAWDGSGTAWDEQTGHTTLTYGGTDKAKGLVHDIKTAGGTVHLFATPTTLSAIFDSESYWSDWRSITVGTVAGHMFYSASGGPDVSRDTSGYIFDNSSSYMARSGGDSDAGAQGAALYVSGNWYLRRRGVDTYHIKEIINTNYSQTYPVSTPAGSLGQAIVSHSPDSFRGNAQMAPSTFFVSKALYLESYQVGDIEGVKFVNMKNYSNEQEITYDGDTYKLFRIFAPQEAGVAFLK